MARGKTKKGGSLVNSLENKVLSLLERLLEEKTIQLNNRSRSEAAAALENGEGTNDEAMEEDDLLFFAKDLKYDEIYSYVLTKDMSMQRMKKHMIQRTIEKVWNELIAGEDEEFKDYPLYNGGEDKDSEDVTETDESNLVPIEDNNDMNKGIVETWGTKKRTTSTSAPTPSTKKIKKTKLKDRSPPDSDLKSLGGMDDVVAQLMELVGLPILHPEIFATTGIEPPRGILLHGPPGCGKTSIANALAGELKVPFISLSAPSVVSGMSGESEKKIRDIFQEAKQIAPCLIFFDEIDAITPKRDGGAQREMEKRIVAQLLTSMDELSFENTQGKPVIVLGATNRPDSLDPALRRAGRFDREICLNVPNEISRLNILKKMSSSLKINGEIDFGKLAKLTPGFVGADLKALTTAAGTCAIKRIFKDYSVSGSVQNDVDMDVDTPSEKNTANLIDPLPLQIITNFIKAFPEPLSEEQLSQLSITYEDFLKALPTIQPTAKREGFATVPDVTWANVGALTNVRIELNMAIVQPIKRPELYEKVGINAPAGVLLWGPPGCGKTLLAKAVANESRANFISIKGPELLNKYVGESERAIRQVFTRARASVPCIIFFDELDALVPRRDTSLSESSSRVVNTLLTELDGLNDRRGIFVVGATNRPDMIDPAMLRPGRLDKTLFIELPKRDEKLDILNTLIKSNGTPLSPDVNLESVIDDERVRNFSGADLYSLVRESSVSALKRSFFKNNEIQSVNDNDLDKEFEDLSVGTKDDQVIVGMDDFNRALQKIKPSVSDKDRLKYDKLNKKMGWNDEVELKE